jgi:hypothetical protein
MAQRISPCAAAAGGARKVIAATRAMRHLQTCDIGFSIDMFSVFIEKQSIEDKVYKNLYLRMEI